MSTKTYSQKAAIVGLAFIASFALTLQAFAYTNLEIEIEFEDSKAKVEVKYKEDGEEVELDFTYDTDDLNEVYELLAEELDLTADAVEDAVTEVENEDATEEDKHQNLAERAISNAEKAIDGAQEAITDAEADEDMNEDRVEKAEDRVMRAQALLDKAIDAEDDDKPFLARRYAQEATESAMRAIKILGYKAADYVELGHDDKNKGHGNDDDKCDEDNPGKGKMCDDEDESDDDNKDKRPMDDKFKEYGKSMDQAELRKQLQELMTLLIMLLKQQGIEVNN